MKWVRAIGLLAKGFILNRRHRSDKQPIRVQAITHRTNAELRINTMFQRLQTHESIDHSAFKSRLFNSSAIKAYVCGYRLAARRGNRALIGIQPQISRNLISLKKRMPITNSACAIHHAPGRVLCRKHVAMVMLRKERSQRGILVFYAFQLAPSCDQVCAISTTPTARKSSLTRISHTGMASANMPMPSASLTATRQW